VRISPEQQFVSLRFGGVGVFTAQDPLRDSGFTLWLDD
jgi:hypothetical protein